MSDERKRLLTSRAQEYQATNFVRVVSEEWFKLEAKLEQRRVKLARMSSVS